MRYHISYPPLGVWGMSSTRFLSCGPLAHIVKHIVKDGGGGGNRTPVRAGYAMRPSPSNPRTPPREFFRCNFAGGDSAPSEMGRRPLNFLRISPSPVYLDENALSSFVGCGSPNVAIITTIVHLRRE
jgi:hypothetical protein